MARKSRRGKAPDEYMLGYAEDEESVENIMAKFAALDDYQTNKGKDTLDTNDIKELMSTT
jgi:hypothetical protein